MILMWTTSDRIGSRLIRFGTEEEASHFCLAFSINGEKQLLLQQEMGGFEVLWLNKWLKTRRVVKALEPIDSSDRENRALMAEILNRFSATEYDHGAFYYFAWRAALRRFFDIPLPPKNKWGSDRDPLCVGIAETIYKERPEWFKKKPSEFDIITPMGLYHLMDQGQFREVQIGSA